MGIQKKRKGYDFGVEHEFSDISLIAQTHQQVPGTEKSHIYGKCTSTKVRM